MTSPRRFPPAILSAVRDGLIIGIRAGSGTHRFIGIWAVMVHGRVFVRSWQSKPGGWYRTLLEEPTGAMQVRGRARAIPIRAARTRSERVKDAVTRAYREKYPTPGSRKYVQGFARGRRRDTTLEILPR